MTDISLMWMVSQRAWQSLSRESVTKASELEGKIVDGGGPIWNKGMFSI
ncbi:hypothetical protein ACJJIR_01770 [Microbulbifer sp. SSSA008]